MPSRKLTEEQIGPFFAEWAILREQLILLHRQRSGKAANMTAEAVNIYERLLAQCSEFEIMPVNGEERLLFVKENLGKYPAFRQLDELFSEMAKKVAAKRSQLNN